MKHKAYSALLSILFAVLFLFNGICPPNGGTDLLSSCTTTDGFAREITSTQHQISSPEQCTLEMLGRTSSITLSNSTKNTNPPKYNSSFPYAIADSIFLFFLFLFLYGVYSQWNPLWISHFYIICYIHRKDGKKAPSFHFTY